MKKTFGWAAAAFLVASAALARQDEAAPAEAAPPPAEPVRVIEQRVDLGSAHKAKLTLAIGEMAVLGEDIDHIEIRTLVFCEKAPRDRKRCEPDARDLSLAVVTDGDRVSIDVKGISDAVSRRLRVRQEVRVPATLPIEVAQRSGDLRIDGVRGDLQAAVRSGSANLHLPLADYRKLDLEGGSQVELVLRDQTVRSTGLGAKNVTWETGAGASTARVSVTIGGVWVTLD